MFNFNNLYFPSKNNDKASIKDVFPHPVSPIKIIGTFALILKYIKIIFTKLSIVNSYSSNFRPKYNVFDFGVKNILLNSLIKFDLSK